MIFLIPTFFMVLTEYQIIGLPANKKVTLFLFLALILVPSPAANTIATMFFILIYSKLILILMDRDANNFCEPYRSYAA